MNYVVVNSVLVVNQTVTEIKERSTDIFQNIEFANFIRSLFPTLRDIIGSKIPPQFEDNDENKVRHVILEIFSRFPNLEPLKQVVLDLINIATKVINEDNEGNAIVALKLLFDLHKTFRLSLDGHVQVRHIQLLHDRCFIICLLVLFQEFCGRRIEIV